MDGMVSVIIPAYNNQAFLPQCLDSVLGERDVEMEVIVVDDGSTDCTRAICEAYALKDSRLRVIAQPNMGPGAARNTGLDNATGEYVIFVDGDDMLMPGALKQLLSMMGDEIDITSGRFFRAATRDMFTHLNTTESYSVMDAATATRRMLYQIGFNSTACGRLYRREAIGDTRFTPSIYYEDLDFDYRLLGKIRKVAITRRHTYFYRLNPDSITSLWNDRRLDVLKITEDIERDSYSRGGEALLAAARDRRMSANFNMFILCSMHRRNAMAARCWDTIVKHRRQSLTNSDVRLKNRIGAALSYLGPTFISTVGRLFYKK